MRILNSKEKAIWLADKIPAYGDYAKEAAQVLVTQAETIEKLMDILAEAAIGFDRVLIQTSDQERVREWQKKAKKAIGEAA